MGHPRPALRDALQASGIRRSGGPRNGFRYRRASGRTISRAEQQRIASLHVPPAWRQVVIAKASTSPVQAMGIDAAGRWQYLYHGAHTTRRARTKFDRLAAFARALPALRSSVRHDLAREGMPRERAIAAALLLMSAAALRPGSEVYARENGTFGLATLRPRHVAIRGDTVLLTFRGKHGVPQRHELRGRRLAHLLRQMLCLPGRELFKYRDARGHIWDLRRGHVNAYVKRTMGARFSARDFRVWFATLVCAAALRRERDVPAEHRAQAILRAIRETARVLGNTPSVARESYVHPVVIEAFRAGRVVRYPLEHPEVLAERMPKGLHRAERALLALLGRS